MSEELKCQSSIFIIVITIVGVFCRIRRRFGKVWILNERKRDGKRAKPVICKRMYTEFIYNKTPTALPTSWIHPFHIASIRIFEDGLILLCWRAFHNTQPNTVEFIYRDDTM